MIRRTFVFLITGIVLLSQLTRLRAEGKPWAQRITVRLLGFEPPDAETEPKPQTDNVRKTRNAKDGADLVFIPAGKSTIGYYNVTTKSYQFVELSSYYIYKNLVTVGQYRRYCKATGKVFPDHRKPDWDWFDDHPMVSVEWKEALAYCQWAGGDLPTEAQWEKAARWDEKAQKSLAYPWGDTFDLSKLWASKAKIGDAGGTTAVGKYGISPYGVTDMAGNVWQWCWDWHDDDFWRGRAAETPDPVNRSIGEKKNRSIRGGSWSNLENAWFYSGLRQFQNPVAKLPGLGFRCVLPVKTE